MSTQRQFVLGIFFLAALSILGFYTLFLTDFTLFGSQSQLVVRFPDAHGLREGDAVLLAGLRHGRVKDLEYRSDLPYDRRVEVLLNLDSEIELLEGARITIEESTFLGGRQINIDPGEPGGPPLPVPPDGAYLGQVQRNPIDALGEVGRLLTENSDTLASILDNFDTIVRNLLEGRGAVGRLLSNEEVADALVQAIESVRDAAGGIETTMTDVNAGKGLLGALVNDPQLLEDARALMRGGRDTVDSLQAIADGIREGEGLANRVIFDDQLANEVEKAIASVSSGAESFATLGAKLSAGEGAFGAFLTDPVLEADVKRVVRNLRETTDAVQALVADVQAGKGTVGKFLVDEELYQETLAAVKLLNRSIEDTREAAPITAFTSVIFAAF